MTAARERTEFQRRRLVAGLSRSDAALARNATLMREVAALERLIASRPRR